MASKENTITDYDIIADCQKIVTNIIQIATHSNKDMLTYLKTTHPVNKDSYAIKRTIRSENLTEELTDRLAQYRQNRIIVIIGRRALLDFFVEPFY
jgi:hypothetical protein